MPGMYDHAIDITSAFHKNKLFVGSKGHVVTCLFMPKIICDMCGLEQSVMHGPDIGKTRGRWYLLESHAKDCPHKA